MTYVVGVDGGGTKTAAVVADDQLRRVGEAITGPSNGRSVGTDVASANIAAAVTQAIAAAQLTLNDIGAICLSIAGFDTDLDLPVPQGAVRQLGYLGPVIMENDVVGAWAGATEARAGLVVIAGTGATGLGMNEHGELWRTDGWDYLLGDAGSGYAVGRAGIHAAMRALDGRAAPTRLARELYQAYGARTAPDMRRLVDSSRFGKFETAHFAVNVADAAEQGDAAAQAILTEAGADLAENAVAIMRRLDVLGAPFTVSTIGGVFKSAAWVVPPFQAAVLQSAPRASFRPPLHPPEIGAAILALRRGPQGDHGSWTLGTGQRRIQRSMSVDEASPPA
jgi:N-acetylglucosamine kinase-like BadF-type ATPase